MYEKIAILSLKGQYSTLYIECPKGGERMSWIVKKGYTFSGQQSNNGIKMDITITIEQDMAMSEVLARYAALSHSTYLTIAREFSMLLK